MQQHHATHAIRPPHMRATTHHMHQHAATGPPPQHIAINLGPPQQQNAAGPIIQLQHQQQRQIHAQNSNYMPQQTQHNRLSHLHPPQQQQRHNLMQSQHRGNQQTIQTTTQMQKLRQQHQLVNSSNNNNNNNNTNNKSNGISNPHQHQLQQQQQQQHMTGQPQQIQQHQRNIHHTTQQHIPNVKHKQQQHQQPHSCTHVASSVNVIKPQQQQQTQSQSQQQTQHGYASGNNDMYNNNSNNSNNKNTNNNNNKNNHNHSPVENSPAPAIVPKSILQNPNRSTNSSSKQQHKNVVLVTSPASTDTTPKEATTTNVPVKNKTEAAAAAATAATTTTQVVSAKLTTTETETTALPAATLSVVSSESLNENAIPQDDNNNKENDDPTTNNLCNELPGDDDVISSECLGASNSAAACKEKTPMCLVNELARLNKITHQYRLTNEKGPAHCKSFTVTLKLGEEEYSAEGYKIKKAQHLAAAKALEKTKYQHPIPKLTRRSEEGGASRATITPTVELNALAMKLGQPTYYLFDPRQQPSMDAVLPPPPPGPGPELMYGPRPHGPPVPHGGGPVMPPPPPHHLLDPNNPYMRRHAAQYHPRFNNYRSVAPIPGVAGYMHPNKIVRYRLMAPPVHAHVGYPPPLAPCKITLIVGKQKFIGTGRTLQSAKHDAASRALQVIRTQAANQLNEILNRSMEESDSKSPISLVHEIGIKRNMPVHFKVLREEGPAHMKNFITACIAGTIVTEGCGNGKKISKKRAAEKMLEELKQLPPLSPSKSPVKRFKVKPSGRGGAAAAGRFGVERSKKRVGGATIKENGETLDIETDKENPISNLIMLLQSRNEPEPVYELISKNGSETTRRREFIMEVSAAGKVARGRGNNTKLAKRNAAQNLLEILSNESASTSLDDGDAEGDEGEPMPQQTVDSVGPKNSVTEFVAEDNEEAVKLSSMSTAATSSALPTVTTSSGQVPGILILRQHKKHSTGKNSLKHAAASTTNAATTSTQKQAASTTKVAVAPVTTTTTTINTPTAALSETSNTKATDSIDNAGSASDSSFASAAHNTSNTGSSTSNSSSSNTASSSGLRMKKQLLYLAQVLGFEVDFSDYPKGNHNEFLTIVTLSTTPEQICHGIGATSEESQNDAAKNALKILSDLDDINTGKAK